MGISFSDWLKAHGHDEAALRADKVHGKQRLEQLQAFFTEEQQAPPPTVARDATGAELKRGDLVTITYHVSATHELIDLNTGRARVGVAKLSLDRILTDGSYQHAICVESDQVKKA